MHMAPSGAEKYRGLAVLLYLAVSPGVRAEARRLSAVRSEAYFEGRLEHQRQPKLSKKSSREQARRPKGRSRGRQDSSKGAWATQREAPKGPKGLQGAGRMAERGARGQAEQLKRHHRRPKGA